MKKQTYELWIQFRKELIEKNITTDLFKEFDLAMIKEGIKRENNSKRSVKLIMERRKTNKNYAR